jgi:structural maintenance of chromosome 2
MNSVLLFSNVLKVVVDSELTGKQLLSKGKLKRRVTIIPLNKISARAIDPKVVKLAEKLVGSDNVSTAISLVEFDKEVDPAMKFVFGNTFICQDSASAKKITFNPEIRTRSVTLEGDLFDPAGTLTGGSRQNNGSVLVQLQALNDSKAELNAHEEELARVSSELSKLRSSADQFKTLKQKYDVKTHEVELIQTRMSSNAHHQLLESTKELEAQLEKSTAELETTKQREAKANADAEKLESQMKNFTSYREAQLKEVQTGLASAKAKNKDYSKDLKARQQEVEQVALEIEELKAELAGLQEQIKASDATLVKMKKEVDVKDREQSERKAAFEEASNELETKRQNLAACDKSIADLIAKRDSHSKELTDNDIEMKKIEHKLLRYHKDKKDAGKFIEHLESKHPWIASEKQYFGKPHTDYDFKSQNPQEALRELTRLQEEQAKLSKQINKKVMSMYEK